MSSISKKEIDHMKKFRSHRNILYIENSKYEKWTKEQCKKDTANPTISICK